MTLHAAPSDPPLADATLIMHAGRAEAPMPPQWVHCLVVLEGQEPGRRLVVGEQPLRLGRRQGLDWQVADPEVSGLHCSLRWLPGQAELLVTDEHSSNGCYIDGERVQGQAHLAPGSLLQIGRQVLRHDQLTQREFEAAGELARDLDKARHYVESLLPPPLVDGPQRVQWLYRPSQQLGGDAFGYQRLDDGRFTVYLIDVCGHGAGAAMHSVSVMNLLRQHALPGADLTEPAQVLAALNTMFQMDRHAGMYFSIWYGVFDPVGRRLRYASAGHHPAYVQPACAGPLRPLRTRHPVIGARPGVAFSQAEAVLAPGDRLHLFSDGLYEVVDRTGRAWGVDDLAGLIGQLPATADTDAPAWLFDRVRQEARPGPLEDDATAVVVTFL